MARPTVVSTESQLADSQDATQLQRRARRRLVGAIALVVFVVIALPIVLDKEPGPMGQDLVIQIPAQDAGKFKNRVLPAGSTDTPSMVPAEAAKPAPVPAESPASAPAAPASPTADAPAKPLSGSSAEAKPVPAPSAVAAVEAPSVPAKERSSETKSTERSPVSTSDGARAQSLLEGAGAWIVPLGAFSDRDNVKKLQAKLTGAGLASYTEVMNGAKGEQTRVRAGPFESKAAAERARDKILKMGLKPAPVAQR